MTPPKEVGKLIVIEITVTELKTSEMMEALCQYPLVVADGLPSNEQIKFILEQLERKIEEIVGNQTLKKLAVISLTQKKQ